MTRFFAAAGLAAALALSASTAMAQDKGQDKNADKDSVKFVKAAIEGNIAEQDVGKLAQEKGQSQAVKDYGAMLVKDHGAANARLQPVAVQMGIEPPRGSSLMQKAEYAKLKLLSGASFDKSFAGGMVKDHKADIAEYEKESTKADAAGAYAKETLPTLRTHLDMAQKLQQQVQTTTGSNSK